MSADKRSSMHLPWPEDGLEDLGHCPVCESKHRSVIHMNLTDRLFGAPGYWTMMRCDACRSAYLDPRPTETSIGLAYAAYETHRPVDLPKVAKGAFGLLRTRIRNGYLNKKYGYDLHPAASWGYAAMSLFPPPLRLEWDHFARHLPRPLDENNRLLDVGCGNGEFIFQAEQRGWKCTGIDFDEKALDHAKLLGLNVIAANPQEVDFGGTRFNAITCHQVLEHVHDPRRLITRFSEWLVPGGTLWIGTPNATSRAHDDFGRNWISLQPPGHLQIFSPRSLINLLEAEGFTDCRIRRRGYFETYSYRVSKALEDGFDKDGYATLMQKSGRKTPLIYLLKEIRSWLDPKSGADLVVTAKAPN